MIVKRKLFSFIDEDGNQGYYLYNEGTEEEKLFSVVEEEREFARGVGKKAIEEAVKKVSTKGNKKLNKKLAKIKFNNPTELRIYRKLNDRSANIGNTVHHSINSRAVNTNNLLTEGSKTASGFNLTPNKFTMRGYGKKAMKLNDIKGYDHASSSPSWNKETMELTRYKRLKDLEKLINNLS